MKSKLSLKNVFILLINGGICMGTISVSLSIYLSQNTYDQLSRMGYHPNANSSKYTIPHLETVAGLATAKSLTSNIIVNNALNFILYPLDKHNILLSSNTVFIFSIHNGSTGPSNYIQFYSYIYSSSYFITISLIIYDAKPSYHSYVYSST